MPTLYIPNIIKTIVADTATALNRAVVYDYGHYTEVCKQLLIKGSGMSLQTRKLYPLVWLVMDFPEEKGRRIDLYCETSLQIIIANKTEQDWPMAKREALNFTPILYPIYEQLLIQISKSFSIETSGVDGIVHTKIDRPYWGGQEEGNSEKNLFNDTIDAIQIKNLKLKIKKIC